MAKPKKNVARCPNVCELIIWTDHSEPADKQVWDEATPKEQLTPLVIFSSGFVQNESESTIELARDQSEDGPAGAFVHIVKKNIILRRTIRVPLVDKDAL